MGRLEKQENMPLRNSEGLTLKNEEGKNQVQWTK